MHRLISCLTVAFILTLQACGPEATKTYNAPGVSASGEFLFEGPNTLQGNLNPSMQDITTQLGLHTEDIENAEVSGIELTFDPDSLRPSVESILVQLVSDELPLISVGTLSPLQDTPEQSLKVSKEVDVLPYLKDSSSMVIVDTNLSTDLDELTANIDFIFELKH